MIKSFRSRALKALYTKGKSSKVQAKHIAKLRRQLALLNQAASPEDMDVPGWHLHPLKGAEDRWSVWVDENWRMTFEFRDGDAYILDYLDYH
jgi:toxin HigB-1